MSYYIDNSYVSLNKHDEELCGDRVETAYYNGTQTLVLADGMGSGVRANILSSLTAKIICTMMSSGMSVEDCVETIAATLPMRKDVMVAYYSAPDEVRELMQKITDMSIEIGKRFYRLSKDISGGVTAIVQQVAPGNYLTSNCSVEMVSNQIYEEFLLDYDTQLAKAFPNFGIHHCGKTMEHVVEGYRKVPNLKFAEVGAFSDIRRVREVLPDVFLNARYSPVRLGKAGEDEVMTEVRDLIAGGMNPAGQVSISCVGLDSNVPDEQIRYFLKACQTVAKEVADK